MAPRVAESSNLTARDWAANETWYNSRMENAYTPLPAELRPILLSQGAEPLRLFDDETHKVYVLVEQPPAPTMDDDDIRRLLAEADEDIARGDVAEWDLDEIKTEARRIFEARRTKSNS